MCGINGFNFNNRQLIEAMNRKIKHRGPDQDGVYLDDDFSLGHTRLSIIDLTEKGRQPMFNEDQSLVFVFNGEIYNFQELRKKLIDKGHKFYSRSDSEVVLHLYEDYGAACLNYLNGIFAFAILDIRKKELFLARDRVGVKPLYYYHHKDKFIFSSEIKSILEHKIDRQINTEAFNHFFRLHYVPHPLTMFDGIYKLPPANYLLFKNNHINTSEYWQVNSFEDIESEKEIIEEIQRLMKDSVKRQLVSDKPVGIFLSGGIDSTSLLGAINDLGHKKISSFSAGFDVYPEKFNFDFQLARKTSQLYSTKHHELIINGKDMLKNMEKIVYHLDEPIADIIQIGNFLLAQFAKQKIDVVLSGDGGDELFGGYVRYNFSRLASRWQKLPTFLRNNFLTKAGLEILEKRFNKGRLAEKLNTPAGIDRYMLFMSEKDNVLKEIISSGCLKLGLTKNYYFNKYFQKYHSDFEKYFMLIDLKTWLCDRSLTRSDKTTMAFGLEQRVPLLDHRLVELSARIPTRYKLKDNGKYIFKKAMKNYLPSYVLEAKKRGWFSPASQWLRTDLKDFAYDVLSKEYTLSTQDYFDFKAIRKMLQDHIDKKEYNLNCLWGILVFQIWAKEFIKK